MDPRFQSGLGKIRIVHNPDFVQIMQRLIINLLFIIEKFHYKIPSRLGKKVMMYMYTLNEQSFISLKSLFLLKRFIINLFFISEKIHYQIPSR